MSLRRPAAHLRRAPSWRRSGDQSYWESLATEGEVLPQVSRPQRAPRPQSAIEGYQLDGWLEHLHDQGSALNDWTSRRAWRQQETPSFSRGSSSCGSTSRCESSLGSQESLQTGWFSPAERRGSLERAHMMQVPKTEQAQISGLAPVRIGWLPIQRRVMMVGDAHNQNQVSNHSASQVKLKQAITPTFQKNRQQDGEVEKSHSSVKAFGVKTWQKPAQDSPSVKQVPEKQSLPANEGDKPIGWRALRRGWNTNRVSAFPGDSQSKELPAGTASDPNSKFSLMTTTSSDPLKRAPFAEPHALLKSTSNVDTKSHISVHRTGGAQPIRATVPLCRTNSSQPSHIQTSSALTTLIPQNKAGFSSITISSRKVCRSASLPGTDSSSLPLTHQPMDPNSRQVTVQRKATIVKVTEQRTMSSSVPSSNRKETPPASHTPDTVVHRRKATIIKVTEHRESFSPAKAGSGTKNPNYRHSYTEKSTWSQGGQSQNNPDLDFTKSPNTSTSDAGKKDGGLHRSTLSLFMSSPPAIAAPEIPPKAVGQRSVRPHRPLSCYGNMFGHTEPSKENVTQPPARKWSFGADINQTNSSGLTSCGAAAKEAGQPVADTLKPTGGQKESLPPGNAERRASPSLTLIKAPDPHSHQSQEEVLALNAAAIIANIKLQRQLSKKKTPNGSSEKDSAASPQGNTVTDEGKCVKPHPDQRTVQHYNQPPAALEIKRSPQTISLQEALQRSRPDFITRSQDRLRELERRSQQRRDLAGSDAAVRQRRARGGRFTSLNDNLFRLRDRAITGKEMQQRSKRAPVEVKKKKEEEKKREAFLSNRQRVELFKKKLLDQLLQRGNR